MIHRSYTNMQVQKQRSATSNLPSQLELTSTIHIHKINMLMHLNDSQIIYKYVAPKAKIQKKHLFFLLTWMLLLANIQYRLKDKFVCEVYNPLANVSGFTNSWNHENEPHMMEEHPLQYDLVFSRSHGETIFRIQTLTQAK